MTASKLTYGTTKNGGGCWKGCLRDERGNVIWVCDHPHYNRDWSNRRRGLAARQCARQELERRQREEEA